MEKTVVSKKTFTINFVNYFNHRPLMLLSGYRYDEEKSYNRNCVDFLKWIALNDKYVDVWNDMFPNDRVDEIV